MTHCANSWGTRVNGKMMWFKSEEAARTAEREHLRLQAKKEHAKNPHYKITIRGM